MGWARAEAEMGISVGAMGSGHRGKQVFQAVTARARQMVLVILFGEAPRRAATGPRSGAGESEHALHSAKPRA